MNVWLQKYINMLNTKILRALPLASWCFLFSGQEWESWHYLVSVPDMTEQHPYTISKSNIQGLKSSGGSLSALFFLFLATDSLKGNQKYSRYVKLLALKSIIDQ